MKLINIMLQGFLFLLSFLVPKNEKNIIFGAGGGNIYKGNPKSLYLYGSKNTKYNCYWITRNKKLYQKLKEKGLKVLYLYSLKGFISILRAKYLVVAQGTIDSSYMGIMIGRFDIINTWHGTGFKKIGVLGQKNKIFVFLDKITNNVFNLSGKKITNFKLILANSLSDQKRKIESFASKNVHILGSPRNDVFFDKKLRENYFCKILGLNKYKKIILYVPTFRDNHIANPFTDKFLEELDSFLKKNNYLFVIKKHHLDKGLNIGDKHTNIKDISSQISDVQELLIDVDIIISDYSSIITDYVLLDKPIIFYMYDYDSYIKNCRDFYYDIKETLPGPFVYNENNLISYLENNKWFEKDSYQKKYKKFTNMFHKYMDGESSERVFNYITTTLGKK